MPTDFDLHLISIQWNADRSIASINAGEAPLATEESNGRTGAEVMLYSKVAGRAAQLAVRSAVQPLLVRADGSEELLREVEDPATGQHWWVELGKWIGDKKRDVYYFDAPTCSHAGRALIRVGESICDISLYPPGFSEDEFSDLLHAFNDALFGLIFEAEGHTQVAGWDSMGLLSDDGIAALKRFITSIRRVVDQPRVELEQITEPRPPVRARPIARTFQELAQKGDPAAITSKTYRETPSTSENRYVRFLADRVLFLTKRLMVAAEARERELGRMASVHESRLNELKAILDEKARRVNLAVLDQEIDWLQQRVDSILAEWQQRVARLCHASHPRGLRRLYVRVSANPVLTNQGLLVCAACRDREGGDFLPADTKFLFPASMARADLFAADGEYTLDVAYTFSSEEAAKGPFEETLFVTHIGKMTANVHPPRLARRLKVLTTARDRLRRTNGLRPLDAGEVRELQKEREAMFQRRQAVDQSRQRIEEYLPPLRDVCAALSKQVNRLEDKGIAADPQPPMSVVFTQQDEYRSVLSSYRELVAQGGINEALLDEVFTATPRGVEALPVVYERWCLLSLIRLLLNDYQFLGIDGDWRKEVIRYAVGRHGRPFTCRFRSEPLQREVAVSYQAAWNGLCPDFLIEVFGSSSGSKALATLVLDAKCKPYGPEAGLRLADDLQELERKYRKPEISHLIYAVHPSLTAVRHRRTAQPWASISLYGGSRVFPWETEEFPDHTRGAVVLRPTVPAETEESHVAPLKRLLGVLFEYSMEQPAVRREVSGVVGSRLDALPDHGLFCQLCGGGAGEIVLEPRLTKRGVKYWCTCQRCSHFFVYSYCYDCNRKLFKHGPFWTYHDLDLLDYFHIICPGCGAYFDTQQPESASSFEV